MRKHHDAVLVVGLLRCPMKLAHAPARNLLRAIGGRETGMHPYELSQVGDTHGFTACDAVCADCGPGSRPDQRI